MNENLYGMFDKVLQSEYSIIEEGSKKTIELGEDAKYGTMETYSLFDGVIIAFMDINLGNNNNIFFEDKISSRLLQINHCVNVSDAYGANQPAKDKGVFDTDKYPYYVFKDLTTRCVGPDNHEIYGKPVQDYWHKAESEMFSGMSKVIAQAAKIKDNDTRAEYITSYCNDKQTKAFEDGKQLLNDVTWEQSQNSNTFKMMRNPETHQMSGEKVFIPPIEINLDASKYGHIPAMPN